MKNIYLDHAATMPLSNETKNYLINILDIWGNPSSFHTEGAKAKQIISEARQSTAKYLHTTPNDIYFTAGGSASNTLAIRGYYLKHHCTILYSPISHKSILKCVKNCKNTHPLKVDAQGFIDLKDLKCCLDTKIDNLFVVLDYANSEIGTIQNIQEIIELIHFYNGIVYIDCTGSISSIPFDISKINADMIGFSGHKIGSLKGVGVFYKKPTIELEPLIYGSQEKGYVGGTENILGIASLGKVVKNYDYSSISSRNRDYVYDYIINNIPNTYLIGASIQSGKRLSNNLYVCFKDIAGESLMILLDMNGIQVSTGSACNSRDLSASTTLSAIGMNKDDIYSCIRMTFHGDESKEKLNYVCRSLKRCVNYLRNFNLTSKWSSPIGL